MPHLRPGSTSVIARLMDDVVGEYDADLSLNPCEVNDESCRLASGVETTFVSMTIHHLMEHLKEHRPQINFQQIFYIPSLSAENTGGFDLSIGVYNNRPRVRTMHKVLYGSRFNRWCDEEWNWRIRHTRKNGEPSGDYRHLNELVENYIHSNGVFRPYLFLHVCYCIHEYRRMGLVYNGICIPDFFSSLRTIVIDLSEIPNVFGLDEWNGIRGSQDFMFDVVKRIPESIQGESVQARLTRLSDLNNVSTGLGWETS